MERGHRVLVTHGNGPQIGEITRRSEFTSDLPLVDLDVAGAMTQGQMGYLLQQEIGNETRRLGIKMPVCTVVTQVIVHSDDPAFSRPTKPIGRFYSAEEAASLTDQYGWQMQEDAGRGHRRVVPSPEPIGIVESKAIEVLLRDGTLVIAAGGGGVPVVWNTGHLEGCGAVIDKDLASQFLANSIAASHLVILTDVDAVYLNFASPNPERVGQVASDELRSYAREGHFAEGSMGPKVEAALRFLDCGGGRAVITSAQYLAEAMVNPTVGTQVVPTRNFRSVHVA